MVVLCGGNGGNLKWSNLKLSNMCQLGNRSRLDASEAESKEYLKSMLDGSLQLLSL